MSTKDKNPHAVALGRRGASKGGKARANAMSVAERRRKRAESSASALEQMAL
ncbi:MAG TPA: hypothetical protein VKT29_17150 [Terriglobales bacterium]|nr:hypothetical protein [Terriglobales bacterium]